MSRPKSDVSVPPPIHAVSGDQIAHQSGRDRVIELETVFNQLAQDLLVRLSQ